MINNKKSTEFGKQMEYWIISLMLKEGLEIYTPFVDDDAIDLIIKKSNGTFIEIQIKARSKTTIMGHGASFIMNYDKKRKNYFFVFYSERLNMFWIMSSAEFIKNSCVNKTGKNIGRRFIDFNRKYKDKKTGKYKEYVYERFNKYIAKDFSRFK
jgi:PD-(D/E)XK endonuclease